MHDAPDSSPNNLRVEMEDILDPDERTNDEVEERRTADHDGEFYDDDRDQDGDTMPLPPLRYSKEGLTRNPDLESGLKIRIFGLEL